MAIFIVLAALVVGVVGIDLTRRVRTTSRQRVAAFVTVVGILALLSPLWMAWALWLAATAGCGRVPVAATTFAAADSYDLPGERYYDVGFWPLIVPEYYCTEQQAKDAGFHHNPLEG